TTDLAYRCRYGILPSMARSVMMATTTQEFTLVLPQDVIEMLKQAAVQRHTTPDQIVAESLRFSLPPIQHEALQRLKHHIQQQQSQSETEIQQHLKVQLTAEEQERLSQLIELNRAESLTAEERTEMESLFDRIEAVATEKA